MQRQEEFCLLRRLDFSLRQPLIRKSTSLWSASTFNKEIHNIDMTSTLSIVKRSSTSFFVGLIAVFATLNQQVQDIDITN